MRRMNLLIASLIGFVGLIIYFITIPTGDNEALVEMTVEAGDEQILEDIFITGYDSDFSQFYLDNDEEIRLDNLSYLEKLDAPNDAQMYRLQQQYPDFINPLIYNRNIQTYSIINAENYIFSAHVQFNEDYSIDNETIYLNVLNKETMEIEEEEVQRENPPVGNYTDVIGMYADYPVVHMIYETGRLNEQTMTENSTVTVGKYNIETKNYTESRPLDTEGYVNDYDSDSTIVQNKNKQLLLEYGDEGRSQTTYFYDYLNNELVPLEDNEKHYIIGDDNQLYSLEFSDNETLLSSYNNNGQKVENEVMLENQLPLDLSRQDGSRLTEIIDDKLYVVLNRNVPIETGEGGPLELQVFDAQSGERVLNSEIMFKTESGSNIAQGFINTIEKVSNF